MSIKLSNEERSDLKEFISKVIADLMGTTSDVLDMSDSTTLKGDLDVDSLTTIELTMMLEDKYSIEIPDGDIDRMDTVGDLIDHLSALMGPQ